MRRSGRRSATAHPAQRELLGTIATVIASGNAPWRDLTGLVVDETKNTFVLETAAGEVTIPKKGQTFSIAFPDGSTAELEGSALAHRPEDRIKKARGPRGTN